MKHFLIMPNLTREKTSGLLERAVDHLHSRGCTYTVSPDGTEEPGMKYDCLLFIGGDGTMLRSAHTALRLDIPITGIDAGCAGYYARIKENEIEEKLERLIGDDYEPEMCTLMMHNGTVPVINDAVAMVKGGVAGFLVVRKNGRTIYSTVSSGIIFSTTIGSTGINLSAGGSVLQNGMDVMEITPVLPNRGMKHSLVIPLSDGVELTCTAETTVSLDGRPENSGSVLQLSRYHKQLKMISFES